MTTTTDVRQHVVVQIAGGTIDAKSLDAAMQAAFDAGRRTALAASAAKPNQPAAQQVPAQTGMTSEQYGRTVVEHLRRMQGSGR